MALGGILALFVVLPYTPQLFLQLTDNILVKIALFIALIASAYSGPVIALAVFIVIAYMFILRNKNKVDSLSGQNSDYMEVKHSEAIASFVAPDTAPSQPLFTVPDENTYAFSPMKDSGINAFYKMDRSFDMKAPALETQSVLGSEAIADQLYGDVRPHNE